MKKFFGALVIALLAIGANAQTFEKGSSIVSAQLGVGGGFGQRIAYEYSLMNLLDGKAAIGVGGSLNNRFKTDTPYKDEYYKVKTVEDWFTVTVNASFHYEFIDKLDTYVTLGLGGGVDAAKAKLKWSSDGKKKYKEFTGVEPETQSDSASKGIFGWVSSLGARYYFTNNWAANVELGWTGAGYITLGATYKF